MGSVPRRIGELEQGDETVDFGVVTHREGRKVWFDSRIMTFPSDEDELQILVDDRDVP